MTETKEREVEKEEAININIEKRGEMKRDLHRGVSISVIQAIVQEILVTMEREIGKPGGDQKNDLLLKRAMRRMMAKEIQERKRLVVARHITENDLARHILTFLIQKNLYTHVLMNLLNQLKLVTLNMITLFTVQ